ncbi:hypothetical protein [Desulfosporosinus sp. FKA]|uniref:hypothetical protein n=1 Tax=Desulfosporosinus sp. FKA TaxID=1969834 RepID=UPI001FA87278|nr:hypothetical protein [Desulfosporosinus sp. FKA]
MDSYQEAGKLKCSICERGCVVPEGKTGVCGLYQNDSGNIRELFPDKYLTVCPISIETVNYLPNK